MVVGLLPFGSVMLMIVVMFVSVVDGADVAASSPVKLALRQGTRHPLDIAGRSLKLGTELMQQPLPGMGAGEFTPTEAPVVIDSVSEQLRESADAHTEAALAIKDAATALKDTALSLKEGVHEIDEVSKEQEVLKHAIKAHIMQSAKELDKLEAAIPREGVIIEHGVPLAAAAPAVAPSPMGVELAPPPFPSSRAAPPPAAAA